VNVKAKWDELHTQKRFCPVYPNDRVVAWTFRRFPKSSDTQYRLLDLGCGAGRHAIFWAAEGYNVAACDFSETGINETLMRAKEKELHIATQQCDADDLPYGDNEFDGVLSYGVLYYLPYERYQAAVREIHRVLKPGGRALVVTRTTDDSRTDSATILDKCTYRLGELVDNAPSAVEAGMTMTFLDRDDVVELFKDFCETCIDRSTITSNNGTFTDDDWLVQVTSD